MSWASFIRQYEAQGREKGDGYSPAHFDQLTDDERARARAILLERGLKGDTTDLRGLAFIGDAGIVVALAEASADDASKGSSIEIARRETLFELTGEAKHLQALVERTQSRDSEVASAAAEALARHRLPAALAGPLARRILRGRHEHIAQPLLQAWLSARGIAIWERAAFDRELPFIRHVLARRPARRAELLAGWPGHELPSRRFYRPGRGFVVALSIALVLGLVAYRYLHTMPVETGETRPSPNGRFVASIMDRTERSFWTGESLRTFRYRLVGGGVTQEITTAPVPGPFFGSRSGYDVIRWTADSSAVNLVFPDKTLRLSTQLD